MGLARKLMSFVRFQWRGAGLHWSIHESGCREKHGRLLGRRAWPGRSCVLWAFRGGVQGCIGLLMSLAAGRSIAGCSGDGLGEGAHVSCRLGKGLRAALVC